MPLLLLVSFLWAFSFGLIKGAGFDSTFLAAARLALALLVFLPFLRPTGLQPRLAGALLGIGAVQFGLMYLAYNASFAYLQAYEVALFTITTPIFVTLLADVFDRKFRPRALVAALLAVIGTAFVVVRARDIHVALLGLALVQLSNAAFALGQVLYKRLRAAQPALRDRDVFALPYLGGFILAFTALLMRDIEVTLSPKQFGILLYLGVIASGLGFFLWNKGATRVSAGTLGVMNNAKVPLAVAVSLLVFGERANVPALLASFAVMGAAVWLAEKK